MIIGTAGHIDHGKTALINALTGTDADRFQEEKRRGLTIDLGFAYTPLDARRKLGFVDVPGHEKFIHNMLAGACGIDYVILVVAADDGPMPQTHEHLAILDLLGLQHGLVAITKIDLVDHDRIAEVTGQVQRMLQATSLVGADIIPVSAATGEHTAKLDALLRSAADEIPERSQGGHFRLAVDRRFTVAGAGIVVTGTVFSGQVQNEDQLLVSPIGKSARVRAIHAQNQVAEIGHTGQRCALNLTGRELSKQAIGRGDWVLDKAIHAPVERLDGSFRLLAGEARALRHWTPVHVHLGAMNTTGRVAVLEGDAIEPGETKLVQLVLARPIGALHGDRFILRDQSAQRTLGGGDVLDPFPPARGRRKSARLDVLAAMRQRQPQDALAELLQQTSSGIELSPFAQAWNITAGEFQQLLAASASVGIDHDGATRVFQPAQWQAWLGHITDVLGRYHERCPDQAGMSEHQLHKAACQALPWAVYKRALQTLIEQAALARHGPMLQLPGHQDTLAPADERLWQRVQPMLAAGGLRPPRARELAVQLQVNEKQLRQLLQRQARRGELHEISKDFYFLPDIIQQLADATQSIVDEQPTRTLTVKDFRSGTGVDRKRDIVLLEFFDRCGFTLRVKDGRRLRHKSREVFG